MSKWGKKSLFIIIGLVTVFAIAGCGKEQTEEEKLQEQIQQAFKDAGMQIDASTNSDEPPSVESTLMEINNFVVVEIWNEGFVNIGHYAHDGKDSTGQTIDMDFMIQQLGKAMETKVEYDTYIQGLDAKYDDVKQLWTKVSGEIDTLYNQVKANPPKANDAEYSFDTGLYEQYSNAFSEAVVALNP